MIEKKEKTTPVEIKLTGLSVVFLVLFIPLAFIMMVGFLAFFIAVAPVVVIVIGVCILLGKFIDWLTS